VASGDAEVEMDPAAAAATEAANMVTTLAMMPMPVNIEQGLVVKRKPAMRTDNQKEKERQRSVKARPCAQAPDTLVQCAQTDRERVATAREEDATSVYGYTGHSEQQSG